MKFGKRFFGIQWTDKDWQQFDNFMVRCMLTYMLHGLIEPPMINYENQLIEEKLPTDFTVFFSEGIKLPLQEKKRYELIKQYMFDQFVLQYKDYAKISRRKFTEWCMTYLKLKHIPSANARKSWRSEDDIIILYPDYPEKYAKTTYIVKPRNINTQQSIDMY